MSETTTQPDARTQLAFKAAELLNKLVGDKDVGPAAKRLIKQINPDANFPDIDAADRTEALVTERTKALQDRLDAFEKARDDERKAAEEAKHTTDLESRLGAVMTKYRGSDEFLQKVVDRMKANNSPDVEAAAAWVNEQNPKPAPAAGSNLLPSAIDLYGTQSRDEQYKALHDNPQRWFDNQVREILNDPTLQ